MDKCKWSDVSLCKDECVRMSVSGQVFDCKDECKWSGGSVDCVEWWSGVRLCKDECKWSGV